MRGKPSPVRGASTMTDKRGLQNPSRNIRKKVSQLELFHGRISYLDGSTYIRFKFSSGACLHIKLVNDYRVKRF